MCKKCSNNVRSIRSISQLVAKNPSCEGLEEELRVARLLRSMELGITVSDEDKDLLSSRTWGLSKSGYLQTTIYVGAGHPHANAGGQKGEPYCQYHTDMHRVVMARMMDIEPWDLPKGMEVDHLNGDKTNNHRDNLELVTKEENLRRAKLRLQAKLNALNEPDDPTITFMNFEMWLDFIEGRLDDNGGDA